MLQLSPYLQHCSGGSRMSLIVAGKIFLFHTAFSMLAA